MSLDDRMRPSHPVCSGTVVARPYVASSSRSQVAMPTARAATCLAWERLSVSIRGRPLVIVAIVTHLVTRPLIYWEPVGGCSYSFAHSVRYRQGSSSIASEIVL